jgi:uncharacterized protein YqeY
MKIYAHNKRLNDYATSALLQQSFSKLRRESSSQNCAGRIELTDTESVTVKIIPCLLPSPEIEQVFVCNCHGCKVLTTIDESGTAEIRCNSGNKKLKEKGTPKQK